MCFKGSRVFLSEGDGNLFGTTNYQLPNPHTDLPLTLKAHKMPGSASLIYNENTSAAIHITSIGNSASSTGVRRSLKVKKITRVQVEAVEILKI